MFDPTTISRVGRAIHEDRLWTAESARRTRVDARLTIRPAPHIVSRPAGQDSTAHSMNIRCCDTLDSFTSAELARLHFQRWLVRSGRLSRPEQR